MVTEMLFHHSPNSSHTLYHKPARPVKSRKKVKFFCFFCAVKNRIDENPDFSLKSGLLDKAEFLSAPLIIVDWVATSKLRLPRQGR
jgi:hypothetical protein